MAEYDRHRLGSPSARQKWLREAAVLGSFVERFAPGSLILDVPCGTGRYNGLFADRGVRWIGCDISADMIAVARDSEFAALGHILADGEQVPVRSAAFDHAVVARFFNLIPLSVVESVLVELRRIVRRSIVVEIRLDEGRATDALARELRARLDRRGRRRQAKGGSSAGRDRLRVHKASDVAEVLVRSGWREVERTEVVIGRLPLRADPLWFLLLEPA